MIVALLTDKTEKHSDSGRKETHHARGNSKYGALCVVLTLDTTTDTDRHTTFIKPNFTSYISAPQENTKETQSNHVTHSQHQARLF
jgi:hypothetical protein